MTLRRRLAGLLSRTAGPAATPPQDAAPDQVRATYTPELDGEPDPGEVVWAWVPYEDDPSRGKDRPVLILDTDGEGWTGLMLSSQDHDSCIWHKASTLIHQATSRTRSAISRNLSCCSFPDNNNRCDLTQWDYLPAIG
jgi:hypothetical protein